MPKTYEDSIVNTQVENQNIVMQSYIQQAQLKRQNISIAQSNAEKNIRVTNSSATAQAYEIQQQSQSQAINNTINNQAGVFENIEKEMGLKGDDLNQYLYLNSLNNQKNAKLLVGLQNSILNFANTPVKKTEK